LGLEFAGLHRSIAYQKKSKWSLDGMPLELCTIADISICAGNWGNSLNHGFRDLNNGSVHQ
jgi:hypothetical protein